MKCVKFLIFAICIVTAKPVQDQDARITDFQQTSDGVGNYHFGFQTSNGIIQHQIGELKKVDEGKPPVNILHGFFFFIAPDNSTHEVRYVSDQFGYRAEVISPSMLLDNYNKDSLASPRINIAEESTTEEQEKSTLSPQTENKLEENVKNTKNVDAGLKFPDRIGTPAIISLQGPPGK